jgi:hypothetical protein
MYTLIGEEVNLKNNREEAGEETGGVRKCL